MRSATWLPAASAARWGRWAAYIAATIPALYATLPDTGHQAYLERPDAYAKLVADFLAGQELGLPAQDWHAIPGGYRGVR